MWGIVAGIAGGLLSGLSGRRDARRAERKAEKAAKAERKMALADEEQRFVRLRAAAELGGFNPLTVLESGFMGPGALPSGFLSPDQRLAVGSMKMQATQMGIDTGLAIGGAVESAIQNRRGLAVDEGNLALDRERLDLERQMLTQQANASPTVYSGGAMSASPAALAQAFGAGGPSGQSAPPARGLSGGSSTAPQGFTIAPTQVGVSSTGIALDEFNRPVPLDGQIGNGNIIDVDETRTGPGAVSDQLGSIGSEAIFGIPNTLDTLDRNPQLAGNDGLYGIDNLWGHVWTSSQIRDRIFPPAARLPAFGGSLGALAPPPPGNRYPLTPSQWEPRVTTFSF